MEHPHKIQYWAFPEIVKPVYKPEHYCCAPIVETENTDKDWWDDCEDDE
jgi:hypothetical protein